MLPRDVFRLFDLRQLHSEPESGTVLAIRKHSDVPVHSSTQILADAETEPVALRVHVCIVCDFAEWPENFSLVLQADARALVPHLEHQQYF